VDQREWTLAQPGVHGGDRIEEARPDGLHDRGHRVTVDRVHRIPRGDRERVHDIALAHCIDDRCEVELGCIDGVPEDRVQFHQLIHGGGGFLSVAPHDLVSGPHLAEVFHQ
jgi:hypothetical protein